MVWEHCPRRGRTARYFRAREPLTTHSRPWPGTIVQYSTNSRDRGQKGARNRNCAPSRRPNRTSPPLSPLWSKPKKTTIAWSSPGHPLFALPSRLKTTSTRDTEYDAPPESSLRDPPIAFLISIVGNELCFTHTTGLQPAAPVHVTARQSPCQQDFPRGPPAPARARQA